MLVTIKLGYQFYFTIFKEWKLKTDPNEVVKKINAKLKDDEFISKENILEWYSRFDKDPNYIFGNHSNIYVSFTQGEKSSKFYDSVLFVNNKGYVVCKEITNNTQFLFTICYSRKTKKPYVIIRDLFNAKKVTTPVSFNTFESIPQFVGEYLFIQEKIANDNFKLHVLKINYDDLTIEELKIDYFFIRSTRKLLPDQLDGQRFVVFGRNGAAVWKIEGKEIDDDYSVDFNYNIDFGERFIGNKIEGFHYGYNMKQLRFCEFDLKTEKQKSVDVLKNLNSEGLTVENVCPKKCCWQGDRFYGMFQAKNNQHQLLVFESKTLKWTDVNISTIWPAVFFVDENEMLTFSIGSYMSHTIFYHVALRVPEKLTVLTKLMIVRESTVYGNDEYINVSREIQF